MGWGSSSARPTLDIDLLGHIANTPNTIIKVFREILRTQPQVQDGVSFLTDIEVREITKEALYTGLRAEKKSVLKLILSSIEFMVTQCQVVIIYSILLWKNINRGKRLIMKENLIDVVVYSGKLMCLIRFDIEIRIGDSRRMKINKIEVVKILITFIWICTKVFGS